MFRRVVFALVLIGAGFVAGLVLTGRMRSSSSVDAQPPAPAAAARPAAAETSAAAAQPRAAVPAAPDLIALAERTRDSVTNISSRSSSASLATSTPSAAGPSRSTAWAPASSYRATATS